MYKIIIFGGTTEGKIIAKRLSKYNIDITISVATNEGKEALGNIDVKCLVNRLKIPEIKTLLKNYNLIIDATHPYASEVTSNLIKTTSELKINYLRLLRKESKEVNGLYFEDFKSTIEYLNEVEGKILLTTGSKDVHVFSSIKDFKERVFVRILPTVEAIQKCYKIGFSSKNIIAMQGPFSLDVNTSIINMINAKYVITKDSGRIGGFDEKVKATTLTNSKLVVIGRPLEEKGYSIDEIEEKVLDYFHLKINNQEKFFPLFINLTDKKVKVFGGGKIANRRIKTLINFTENIKVISPNVTEDLNKLYKEGKIDIDFREYKIGDCKDCDIVFGLTNVREVNRSIYEEGKELNIYFNIGDRKEECNFYFPGIVVQNDLVIGVTASGKDHKLTKKIKNVLEKQNLI